MFTQRVWMLVAAAITFLPVGTFEIDRGASRVEFLVKDNRGGFTGVVRDLSASVAVREQGASFAGDVQVQIDARTMTTGVGVRDNQMRRDFLETGKFPFITFRGTIAPVDRVGALPFRATLKGLLAIKQVTQEVEIPVRVTALRDTYLAEGQVTIKMSDFKIPIPRFLIFVAEDPVTVTLKVRFAQK
jgi:polyisoprenoid-binding protein YceI